MNSVLPGLGSGLGDAARQAAQAFAVKLLVGVPLIVLATSHPAAVAQQTQPPSDGPQLTALTARYECRADGFGGKIIPAHALVRVNGQPKIVSFDLGWAMTQGQQPGQVIAFCKR